MTADLAGDGIDFRSLLDGTPDLITVANLKGVYLFVSDACHRLFGWAPGEIEGRSEDDFVPPDDLASLRSCRAALSDTDVVTAIHHFSCRDGSDRWVETSWRHVNISGTTQVLSAVRDITERHALTMSLRRQAFSDPLTGVANRPVLLDRLNQGLRRLPRVGGILAVLYLDLDRFKVVNDSLGHSAGNAVLLQMADRLGRYLRPADTLARLGGDEFVIVAERLADEQSVFGLAERIIDAARKPFHVEDGDVLCTVSVGIVCTADAERNADDLLGEADLALYRAKQQGGDRAETFDKNLRVRAVGRLTTERVLRRALNHQQLVVEYQPIIDLRTSRAVGAEALMRIRDPEWGLLLPQYFLEVAEETGLLNGMDEQVLAAAAAVAGAWHARRESAGLAEIAINVTARHLAEGGFPEAVIDQLDAFGVPHRNLQIELTERTLLEASDSAMTALRALRQAGVQIGLDDFGTGYSSLAYLGRFPLDFVKIDKSFIDQLETDDRQQAIVASIIDLLHALDLTVIAEGIETAGQLHVLEHLECDRAQGFLFAASGPPGAIDQLAFAKPTP